MRHPWRIGVTSVLLRSVEPGYGVCSWGALVNGRIFVSFGFLCFLNLDTKPLSELDGLCEQSLGHVGVVIHDVVDQEDEVGVLCVV